MKTLNLITVFTLCLLIKVSASFGAEGAQTSATPQADKPEAVAPVVTATAPATVKITESPVVTTANGVTVETRTIEKLPAEPTTTQKHFEGSSETKIENNITIDGRGLAYGAVPAVAAAIAAPTAAPALVAAAEAVGSSRSMSITPLAGVTAYQGQWNSHISNRGTVGLVIDIPLISVLSLEAEGTMGRFNISYSGTGHNFNQYSGGANARVTLGKGLFQPYFGLGMMAVYYEGMSQANQGGYQQNSRFSNTIGAGQLVAGADLNLFGGIAIGARGEMLRPLTNLPANYNQNGYAAQGAEDASAMSTNFYRLLGTVRVSF